MEKNTLESALKEFSQASGTNANDVKEFFALMSDGSIKRMPKEDMATVLGGLFDIGDISKAHKIEIPVGQIAELPFDNGLFFLCNKSYTQYRCIISVTMNKIYPILTSTDTEAGIIFSKDGELPGTSWVRCYIEGGKIKIGGNSSMTRTILYQHIPYKDS